VADHKKLHTGMASTHLFVFGVRPRQLITAFGRPESVSRKQQSVSRKQRSVSRQQRSVSRKQRSVSRKQERVSGKQRHLLVFGVRPRQLIPALGCPGRSRPVHPDGDGRDDQQDAEECV